MLSVGPELEFLEPLIVRAVELEGRERRPAILEVVPVGFLGILGGILATREPVDTLALAIL